MEEGRLFTVEELTSKFVAEVQTVSTAQFLFTNVLSLLS